MKRKIGLVIGSGNLKCLAALGLAAVLQQEGIQVDLAVGCSGGSPIAASIAVGIPAEDFKQMAFKLWTRKLYTQYRYLALLRAILTLRRGSPEPFGLLDDRLLMRALYKSFGTATFAETKIPLFLLATDLLTGERVSLNEGRIVDAIRASVAIPVLFPPWQIDGRLLIDGGASDPLPVDVAIREGCDIILAMGFETPYTGTDAGLPAILRQTSTIMMNNLIRATYAFHNLAHHAELIPILPRFSSPIGLTDTHLIPQIIELGAQAAKEQVPYLRRLLES